MDMLDVDIVDRMRRVKDSRGEEAEVRMWRAWSWGKRKVAPKFDPLAGCLRLHDFSDHWMWFQQLSYNIKKMFCRFVLFYNLSMVLPRADVYCTLVDPVLWCRAYY